MRTFERPIPPACEPGSSLSQRLRSEMADAHAALERALDLTPGKVGVDRMRRLLARFYGFHRVWEPAIAAGAIGAFARPRARLDRLRDDLVGLDLTEAEIADLPRCEAASALAAGRAEAIGSLYVMEGSTLGGQVIGKILRDDGWPADQRLAYFNPYGKQTAERWREFIVWAEATARPDEQHRVVSGALATFALLREWLPG